MTTPRIHLTSPAGFSIAIALAALAVASRLMDLGPNLTAVAAVALFAGFVFRPLVGVAITLLAMLVSDALIGFHDWRQMIVIYSALAVPAFFAPVLTARGEARPQWIRLLGASVAGSLIFFFASNLAVWAFSGMYAKSLSGLVECFTLAVPFYRFTVLGDLAFAAAMFGGWSLVTKLIVSRNNALAPSLN